MDVPAVILEDGAFLRVGQALLRRAVEPERRRDALRFLRRLAVDVDPEQPAAAEPLRAFAEVVELLDVVTFEEDCAAHPEAPYPSEPFGTRTTV